MKSNNNEDDNHKRKFQVSSEDDMGPDPNRETLSHKIKTTTTLGGNSPSKCNVAKKPSEIMTKQETDATSCYFSILPKIYRLESLLADLGRVEHMKLSELWGGYGVNLSEVEEIGEKIYKRVWRVKKISDDDDGPIFVIALCVVVEHLTQCFHRKKSNLSELDKKIVSTMSNSLHLIRDGNIDRSDLVPLVNNLKLSLFHNMDFTRSIVEYCNIEGSEPGEYREEYNDRDSAKEREKKYLEMMSG